MIKLYKIAADYIKKFIDEKPQIGLILGSGLGSLAESIESPVYIDYSDIPGFSKTTIQEHIGRFVSGKLQGKNVIAMQGRYHYYEGKEPSDIVLPVYVMKALGVEILIITNAAGGVNTSFKAGDIMIITDHINLSGVNPLRGPNPEELGQRFPDMTYAYNPDLKEFALKIAKKIGINIKTGVYAMMQGPSYETPAEIRMLRILGADAVGMSTVPEVIAAVHAGMKVLGISCITNMAAGVLDKLLSHVEVIETAEKTRDDFVRLLNAVISAFS